MKKLLLILSTLLVLLPFSAHADLWGGIFGPGWGTLTDTKYCTYDSATNTVVCNSTGGVGDVTAASTAQTWGDGTGPVVWTFSVTGTDPTISVATGAFTINTDLALGANDITMTGSLGATGSRVTKGWFTDLEVTNAITGAVTGNAGTATALAADPADCPAGQVATGIAASGALTCTATPSGLTSVGATTFTGALTGTASGNIPNSLAEAKGDLAVASADDTWGRMAHPGAANYVLTTNAADTYAWAATHSHSDSAAQFYDASAPTALVLINPATVGTHTISPVGAYEFKYTLTAATDVTMPVSGTIVSSGVATGGVILGDSGPDAAGELGYASTQLIFHDGTSARNVAKAGTLTNTKWCSSDGTVINCTEDAPAGSGDITAVGSCTTGSCASIGNADTSGGYIDFLEDSDNGTNYVRLKAPDSTADATVTLPNTTGTLAILGANTFTADQTITGNILPEAANTRTIGSATAEWADLYLGDGAVINLGNDQDVTITHVADSGLTLAANSEDLTLAATANTWTVSSSTGVTDIKFQGAAAANAMNLATTGTILGAVKVLNAGATEGSGAHTYSPGAADIYGSMILITDSDSVTTVNLPDYQASADADHVKIGASVCVYNTVAKATIVDVAADDKITTTNGTTNAAGASVTGPATIGAFSCFMLVSASSDVGNWAQLGLNGAWPVTP